MEEKKLPSMLNVLTILTFIGSGFGLLISIVMPWFVKFMINFMKNQMSSAGDKLKTSDIEGMNESISKLEMVQNNMTINIIVGVLFCSLCIVAAILIRKRKKDGYNLYLIARIAPLIVSFFILKNVPLNSATSIIGTLFLPVLMIILYSTQRKHLTK
jgi:ABC-type spermidine/putrescine transport system permease subunit II